MNHKKKHDRHEDHLDETWLIPYADLLTLLLALFIVLYAISSLNVSKFEEMSHAFNVAFTNGVGVLDKSSVIGDADMMEKGRDRNRETSPEELQELKKQEQESLEKLQEQIDAYIVDKGLTAQLETSLDHAHLTITIQDNALFDSGSASIKPDAQALAVSIGQMLQEYPGYEVVVSGHTDDQPINTAEFASNWELSSKRAINFMKILLQNPSFDPTLFSAIGYGEYRPVADNGTALGRAKNRRVEVSLLRKYTEANAAEAKEKREEQERAEGLGQATLEE